MKTDGMYAPLVSRYQVLLDPYPRLLRKSPSALQMIGSKVPSTRSVEYKRGAFVYGALRCCTPQEPPSSHVPMTMPCHTRGGDSMGGAGWGITVVQNGSVSGAAVILVVGGVNVPAGTDGVAVRWLELGARVGEGETVTVSVAVAVSVTVCGRGSGTDCVDNGASVDAAESSFRA